MLRYNDTSKNFKNSIEYINVKTKLKWQCERRHIWMATPDNIKSGRWCPKCRSKKWIFCFNLGIYFYLESELWLINYL